MICGICKVKEAKIFYTEIVNGEKTEQYLCEECAAKNTHFRVKTSFAGKEFSLGNFLNGLLGEIQEKSKKEMEPSGNTDVICPNCGMTYAQFHEQGKLGCAKCYRVFGKQLGKSLHNLHGNDIYTGRKPEHYEEVAQESVKAPVLSRKEQLQMSLLQAIEREDYEKAAKLRDEIHALDSEPTEKKGAAHE